MEGFQAAEIRLLRSAAADVSCFNVKRGVKILEKK
jgi:hypothetical protein